MLEAGIVGVPETLSHYVALTALADDVTLIVLADDVTLSELADGDTPDA